MMPLTLTRDQAQAAVATAAAERDAIQANLLDLDGSFGKRMLAGATLSGETRKRWEAASAGLAALWETFSAYSAVIDRAAGILTQPGRLPSARLEEVSGLLTGASVRLPRAPVPLGERDLTAGGDARLTLAEAVVQMKRAFTALAGEVTAAETVWNEISDGLRQVADCLDEARRQSAQVTDGEVTDGLPQADSSLAQLRERLNSDPLSLWRQNRVDTGQLDRLREQAAAVAARSAGLARTIQEADQRIAEVSATVAATAQAWQDATAARERAAARVLVTALDPLPDISGLDSRLGGLAGLKAAGRWTRLASELDLVGKLASAALRQCREAEQAAAGLLGRRDELRGLLDAYRAKAGRLGGAEDTVLDASYRQAHDLLWTAPCDLVAATAAVTGYQQAVLRLGRSGERT
ncbi:MAG TPA: hypothetical protein VF983_12695 [Streptosporangiaceae bacterium]